MRHFLPGLILAATGGLLCGADGPTPLPDPDKIYSQEEALRMCLMASLW